ERVIHLEIALGYQHRGVERSLEGGPDKRTIHLVEAIAGDTAVGHALAFSQLIEALSGAEVPPRAQAIRAVALELERPANGAGVRSRARREAGSSHRTVRGGPPGVRLVEVRRRVRAGAGALGRKRERGGLHSRDPEVPAARSVAARAGPASALEPRRVTRGG